MTDGIRVNKPGPFFPGIERGVCVVTRLSHTNYGTKTIGKPNLGASSSFNALETIRVIWAFFLSLSLVQPDTIE